MQLATLSWDQSTPQSYSLIAPPPGPRIRQPHRFIAASLAASDEVQQEDTFLCENVQAGLESAGYDRGRYEIVCGLAWNRGGWERGGGARGAERACLVLRSKPSG